MTVASRLPGTPVTDTSPLSVVLVDDHRIFSDVLAMRLRSDPAVVSAEVASSLDSGLALVRARRPDLVLLDYDLGDECGLDLMPGLLGLPDPPVVMVVSAMAETGAVVRGLRAGARGWFLKSRGYDELRNGFLTAMGDALSLPPASWTPVLRELLEQLDRTTKPRTFVDGLTDRQVDVLRCLVAGMTRTEVGARLYLSSNTVRTHVQRMLAQTGLHSTAELVAAARAAGLTQISSRD